MTLHSLLSVFPQTSRHLRLCLKKQQLINKETVVGVLANLGQTLHDFVLVERAGAVALGAEARLLQVVVGALELSLAQFRLRLGVQVLDLRLAHARAERVGA